MTCEDNVCGTGGWTGPKPGDPDNDLKLSVNTVFGGINVVWSYPSVNGHAVSYTTVFRGVTADFNEAIEIAKVGGSIYFDKLNPATRTAYYYWIQVMSVNGTLADPIGPASTYAVPLRVQTLETLAGMIEAGQLSEDLKTSIAGITNNNLAIAQEIQDRLYANSQFAASMADIQNGLEQAMTFINQEVTARQDGDNAMVTAYNQLAAANKDALAAIDEERTVRVSQNDSLTDFVTSQISQVNDNIATSTNEVKTYADGQFATASDFQTLASTVGDSQAGLVHDMKVVSDAQQSMAQDISTVEASLNGDTATGQVGLVTKVDQYNGTINKITAEYFAKVQVDGLVGGFGLLNDGTSVEAGFDVDRFWVGRTSGTGTHVVKPFIIDNDTVYIDKARIRDADIDSLKLAGEAVTVPVVSTAVPSKETRGSGEGIWKVINEGFINMTQPGMLYVLVTSAQGFYQNQRYWSFKLRINGNEVRSIMGRQPNDAPVFSASVSVPQGVTHVEVLWSAHSDVIIGYNEIFMMGAKR